MMNAGLRRPEAAGRAGSLIEGWSNGLAGYAPEEVAKQTGVPVARIERLAREFAEQTPSVALIGGCPVAQTNGLFSALATRNKCAERSGGEREQAGRDVFHALSERYAGSSGRQERRAAAVIRKDRSRHSFGRSLWIAAGGGVLGLIVAYLLASGTQKAWPLDTGGMPVVAMWPNIIIMFELTMLGAILATVVSLFITARLPTFESKLYDPEISNPTSAGF